VAVFEQPAAVKTAAAAKASQRFRFTLELNISHLQRGTLGVNGMRRLVGPFTGRNLQTDYEQRVSLVFPKSYRVRLLESRRIRGARFLPSTGLSASTRVQQADPLEDRRVAEPRCANESLVSVANKRLATWLNPLDATLTKKHGGTTSFQPKARYSPRTLSDVPDPSPIFRMHFQVPYPVSPLFATLTKTAGVCTNNSHSGTRRLPLALVTPVTVRGNSSPQLL
jgi:hypothetical protein